MNIGPYEEVYFDACFVELIIEISGEVGVENNLVPYFNSASKCNLSV